MWGISWLAAQKLLGTKLRFDPNMAKWGSTCNHNYLYRWLPCQYFILLMMGAWRPKHVEKVCSNKICILLHHVGVLFNLILWWTETRNKKKIDKTFVEISSAQTWTLNDSWGDSVSVETRIRVGWSGVRFSAVSWSHLSQRWVGSGWHLWG